MRLNREQSSGFVRVRNGEWLMAVAVHVNGEEEAGYLLRGLAE